MKPRSSRPLGRVSGVECPLCGCQQSTRLELPNGREVFVCTFCSRRWNPAPGEVFPDRNPAAPRPARKLRKKESPDV